MIDIVFLLIVFFMTVAHLKSEQLVPIDVPIADESVIPQERGVRATVTIDGEGAVFYGGRQVPIEELAATLAQSKREQPSIAVQLRADARVPFREVRRVLDACASGGIPDVIFANYQTDK
jgi:biopolymer transport protein ExbD